MSQGSRPSWTSLHAHLHQTLKERRLLEPEQPVLVAVSGGQDSLCLIQLLLDLQPKWGWQLAIAHCNHRWRADAEANANHVQALAQAWKLPYHLQTADPIPTTEATARQWRYQRLEAIAQQYGYRYVATGHTASDRAETLLYNLIRGSGMDGLQALAWQRQLTPTIQLVRPLLTVQRIETAQFCHELSLQVWDDSTNQNLDYARNRIRHELLPYLQQHFNPQTERALAQTAELLQAEVDYLESEAIKLLQLALVQTDPASLETPQVGLNRVLLQPVAIALQRRVVRQFLHATLPCAPSFDHIEKFRALLTAPNRSQTDPFPGGTIAYVDREWIWLKPANPSSYSA